LSAATAVLDAALAEREPHARLFDGLDALIATLQAGPALAVWAARYVRFELDLLADLGFGLDLARCAATGATEGLAYVSPKTGRAVAAAAAEPYRDRLLPLPAFLLRPAENVASGSDILAGLTLTGFFLAQHVFSQRPAGLPAARDRLVAQLQRTLVQAVAR
jgi:DNA repair protein RecO (recombination protein O)